MRDRTPEELLILQGGTNLRRSQKRNAVEANTPVAEENRDELAQVNELIARAMKCCRRGSIYKGKKNPSFEQLSLLVKVRDSLVKRKKPTQSTAEILAAADEFMRSD